MWGIDVCVDVYMQRLVEDIEYVDLCHKAAGKSTWSLVIP